MTVRVYLGVAKLLPGPPQIFDIPAERLFVHASDVPELWVESESANVPGPGKSVSFSLARPLDVGIERVVGTVERVVDKETRARLTHE
jgi:hypothetical protein